MTRDNLPIIEESDRSNPVNPYPTRLSSTLCNMMNICILLALVSTCSSTQGQSLGGEPPPDSEGTVRTISEKFGKEQLKKLYSQLNSIEFQSALTNYNCGNPVPKFKFYVSLQPQARFSTRSVMIDHWPGQSPSGHSRCLLFGIGYLLDVAVAKLDPDPQNETTRDPKCDCSKRDGGEEWVTHPGLDIILAPNKVAAREAAKRAEEAVQEKEENLGSVHLDWTKLQLEPQSGEQLVTKDESLGKLLPGADVNSLIVDGGFKHLAYVVRRGTKEMVVVDGVEGKVYDKVAEKNVMNFSPDGMRIGYIAKRGEKKLAVVDGKEGKEYDSIHDLFNPVFSPDSRRVAYIATLKDKAKERLGIWPLRDFLVVDGVKGRAYQLVEGVVFSPDGNKVIYFPQPIWNRATRVVMNEVEGKEYDYAGFASFSPDSSRLAYIADQRVKGGEGKQFAVIDGKEGRRSSHVSPVAFSPDSKHFAYTARDGGTVSLLRNDNEQKYAGLESVTFSPDSQHLAYVARTGTNWLVLMDGQKIESLSSGESSFSPIRDMTFSPDSRHLAYLFRSTNWVVTVDGHVLKHSDGVLLPPLFSPNSKRLAYIVTRDGKSILNLGGHEVNAYDRFIIHVSNWRNNGPSRTGFAFDEKGILHAIAMRGDEVFRLEISLLEK